MPQQQTVHIFKQLCTDPLARDPRILTRWHHAKPRSGKLYIGEVTGNPEVKLHWYKISREVGWAPRLRQEPRCPTAMCTNLLLQLLMHEQRGHPLEFTSRRHVGLKCFYSRTSHPYYQNAATDGLRLWQQLGIEWPGLNLPPPIDRLEFLEGKRFKVHLNIEWLRQCAKDNIKLYLPVPMFAGAQNIVLNTYYKGSQENMDIRKFYARMTGNQKNVVKREAPVVPLETWVVVRNYYSRQGARIEWRRHPYIRVRISRRKKWVLKPSTMMDTTVWYPVPGVSRGRAKAAKVEAERARQARQEG